MSSCEQLFTYTQKSLRRLLAAVALTVLAVQPAGAHIQTEAPWHAIAYAYLNTLVLLDLKPVDWPLIEEVLTTDHEGRILGRPASERLIELDQTAGTTHWEAIETALQAKSADALHAATTRAVSSAIRHHLTNAAAALAVQRTIAEEDLLKTVIEMGQRLSSGLMDRLGAHPNDRDAVQPNLHRSHPLRRFRDE